MMRNNRARANGSSSDEDSDDSDSSSDSNAEEDRVIQVGFMRVQYRNKDIVKETLSRFS
jgi:hypothetical protein